MTTVTVLPVTVSQPYLRGQFVIALLALTVSDVLTTIC